MRIGIYGGSYNPVHKGHISAALGAIEHLKLDKLIFMPAGTPPHKSLSGTEDRHRLAMLQLAVENMRRTDVEVSTLEMEREGKSYSVDTVRHFRESNPDDELFLLMGTDMLESFLQWYQPEEILKYVTIGAFGRNDEDSAESLQAAAERIRAAIPCAKVETFVNPYLIELSSTDVREALAKGGGEAMLDPAVYGYILREKLYGTKADLKHLSLDELRPVALSYLKGKRVPHVLGTEETAEQLAKRYGADSVLARRAALLHDCTKRLSMEQQLALAKQYGIALDDMERTTLKLQHAKTGAAIAEHIFGECSEVVQAIRWHTTGKANMTTLEKVIYLADYIEPTRDFPGLAELRETAKQDLDRAVLLGLIMTKEEMKEWGEPLHPDTETALACLKGTLA